MQYLVHDTRALGKNAGRWTFVTVGNCVCVRGKQVNPTPTQPNPPHPNPPHPIPSQPTPPHPTPAKLFAVAVAGQWRLCVCPKR